MKIALIMLAAGNSRRFGSNKLLYEVDGIPMYQRTLDCLCKVKDKLRERGEDCSVTVVTQYGVIGQAARKAGAQLLYNMYPEEGISFSMRIGLKANLGADACLFAVSDQPWIQWKTILGMWEHYLDSQKGMACLSYGDRGGNPCIFSRKYYKELLSLSGDSGGKCVMRAHPEDTTAYGAEKEQELDDIDYSVINDQ